LNYHKVQHLYISTDEADAEFFKPFIQEFKTVSFLGDFMPLLADFDSGKTRYHGMIEQAICATGKVFIGTVLSTYSAYITRLRHMMDPSVAQVKEVYFTSVQSTGDPEVDLKWSKMSWMNDGSPRWPHSSYLREWKQFAEIPPEAKDEVNNTNI